MCFTADRFHDRGLQSVLADHRGTEKLEKDTRAPKFVHVAKRAAKRIKAGLRRGSEGG